jgi:hypothetical protein
MAEGTVQRVRIKFNDTGEQKLIPPLSVPKKPPTKAQIKAARIMAEAYSSRKGILAKTTTTTKKEEEDEEKPPQSPISAHPQQQQQMETDDEQEEEIVHQHHTPPQQQQYAPPPSSPEIPSFYRGKPPELTSRRY